MHELRVIMRATLIVGLVGTFALGARPSQENWQTAMTFSDASQKDPKRESAQNLPMPISIFAKPGNHWPLLPCKSLPFRHSKVESVESNGRLLGVSLSNPKSIYSVDLNEAFACDSYARVKLEKADSRLFSMTSVVLLSDGGLAVAEGGGPAIVHLFNETAIARRMPPYAALKIDPRQGVVHAMLAMPNGVLLVGTSYGCVYMFNSNATANRSELAILKTSSRKGISIVVSLVLLFDGEIAVGSESPGFICQNTVDIFAYNASMVQDTKLVASFDVSGIGSMRTMITISNSSLFAVAIEKFVIIYDRFGQMNGRFLLRSSVTAIAELTNGFLVVGTDEGEVNIYDGKFTFQQVALRADGAVTCLLPYQRDLIIGSSSGTVYTIRHLSSSDGAKNHSVETNFFGSRVEGFLPLRHGGFAVNFFMGMGLHLVHDWLPNMQYALLEARDAVNCFLVLPSGQIIAGTERGHRGIDGGGIDVFAPIALTNGGVSVHSLDVPSAVLSLALMNDIIVAGTMSNRLFVFSLLETDSSIGFEIQYFGELKVSGWTYRLRVFPDGFLCALTKICTQSNSKYSFHKSCHDGFLHVLNYSSLKAGGVAESVHASVPMDAVALTMPDGGLAIGDFVSVRIFNRKELMAGDEPHVVLYPYRFGHGSLVSMHVFPDGGLAILVQSALLYFNSTTLRQKGLLSDLLKYSPDIEVRNSFLSLSQGGLLLGGSLFSASQPHISCTAGQFSKLGEMLCSSCPDDWLSGPGAESCAIMSWRLFLQRVLLKEVALAFCIAFFAALPYSCKCRYSQALSAILSCSALSCCVVGLIMSHSSEESKGMSLLEWWGSWLDPSAVGAPFGWTAVMIAFVSIFLIIAARIQVFTDILRASFPWIVTLLLWSGCIALLVIGAHKEQSRAIMTPFGIAMTHENTFAASIAFFIACVLSCLGLLIFFLAGKFPTRLPMGEKPLPHGWLQGLDPSRGDRACFFYAIAVRMSTFSRSWVGQHTIGFVMDIYVIVPYSRELASSIAGLGGDTRQAVLCASVGAACFSASVHALSVLAHNFRTSYQWLGHYEDRHFRVSVIARFQLLISKLVFISLPTHRLLRDSVGVDQFEIPYSWSCFDRSNCPASCTRAMLGQCSVVALTDGSLQCVCSGLSPERWAVVFSAAVSIVLLISLPAGRLIKLWNTQQYREVVHNARRGIIAMFTLLWLPQCLMVCQFVYALVRVSEEGWRMPELTLAIYSYWSLAPCILLANECKWTLASWSPPLDFLQYGALDRSTSRVQGLRPLVAAIACIGAAVAGLAPFDHVLPRAIACAGLMVLAVAAIYAPGQALPWTRDEVELAGEIEEHD